jgi:hypothetical protein
VSIPAGHPVLVIQARRAVSASAVSASAASDTSCRLLLRRLQLTAGVGPTNRVCGLVAGPPGRIRLLIGPICCVTGSKRALELDRGRDRAPAHAAHTRSVAACATVAGMGAGRVRASGTRVGRRRALGGGRSRASGVGRRASAGVAARYTVSIPNRATTDRCEPPARKASMIASRRCATSQSARLFRDRGPSRSVLAYAIQLECSGTRGPSRDRPGLSRGP